MARTFVSIVVGVMGCVLILPAHADAQQASGIAGGVRDTSGALLPGVTVEAASPVLIEKVRTVVTDGTDQYRIVDLRPGTYSVTFTLAGFAPVRRQGIDLAGSFTATVNVELKVGAIEETITVSGATPLVDVQNVARQTVISKTLLDAVPTAKSVLGIAALMPANPRFFPMRINGATARPMAAPSRGRAAGNNRLNIAGQHLTGF